jgi:hypothetical protein
MNKISIIFFLSVLLFSCNNQQERQTQNENQNQNQTEAGTSTENATPSLTKVWETDAVMTTAESTLYDKNTKAIYVSNINGNHSEKDGSGFISKMNTDGSVSEQKWVTGLNAPKGLAVMNGNLYVTDIDELVEINMSGRKITKKYPVQGATFLNDAATDGKKIYFSDSQTGKVHVMENGKVSTLTEGMEGINGLAFNDNGQLFVLDGKGLRKYNMENKNTTGGDGLVIIDDNTYIASRWQGEIYLIKDGKEHLLLDTKAEESNTADIDYIEEENLVLVPTFMKNKVVAYKLDY